MKDASKKILVVGGAGYIGSHMCKTLKRAGYLPICFDNLSAGHEHAVKWGPLEVGDIRDGRALDTVFQTYQPDAVIHFAAKIEVGEGEKKPFEFYENNVGGTLSLLNAMTRNGVKKLVFSSTCAVYGDTNTMPLNENQPARPLSVYARTKYATEGMMAGFAKAHGIHMAALRYFNASGADLDGEIGEEHDPETHLIPNALKAAAKIGDGLKLFGTDYDTPDGTCIRDYIHVQDLVDAHLRTLEVLDQHQNLILNLGTGAGTSVLEIINAVKTVTGMDVPYQAYPRRAGDVPKLYADVSKMEKVLNFTPKHSDIETIIKTAWKFHRKKWGVQP